MILVLQQCPFFYGELFIPVCHKKEKHDTFCTEKNPKDQNYSEQPDYVIRRFKS